MEKTLFDSERKVMELIWKEGEVTAKQISLTLRDTIGWNKNITYTVIKKCIQKGFIERLEPNFVCRALLSDSGCHRFSEVFSSKMPRTVFLFLWMLAWCKLMIPIPTGFSVSVTNGWFEKMPDITTALSIPATAWRHLGQSLIKERVNHLIHMKEKFLRIFCPFYQSSL